MRLVISEEAGFVVIRILGNLIVKSGVGRVNIQRLHDYFELFIKHDDLRIVVGLEKMTCVDSAGLGILVGAMTAMRNKGGDVRLAGMLKRVEELLSITGLIEVFKHYPSVEEAVESFKTDPPSPPVRQPAS